MVDNYIDIFRTNQAIEKIPEVDIDATQKNRYLGEVYFLRGFFYFTPAILWGNFSLMLSTSNENVPV